MKLSSFRKFNKNTNKDTSLGCEIKRRRLISNHTLASVSYNICSLSYMSKIESNKIEANSRVLNQVCKKLSMTQEEIDTLVSSKEILDTSLFAFRKSDETKMKENYLKVKTLTNFRADIIKLIYFLFKDELTISYHIIISLDKLVKNFSEEDACAYYTLVGVYQFKTRDYAEAIDILKYIYEERSVQTNILHKISLFYLTKSYGEIGSDNFLQYYQLSINEELNINAIDKIADLKQLNFMYYVKNNNLDNANKLKYLLDPKLSIDALAFYSILKRDFDFFTQEVLKDISFFTLMLYTYEVERNKYQEMFSSFDCSKLSTKEHIHLTYLNYKIELSQNPAFLEHFITYLTDTAVPYAIGSLDRLYAKMYIHDLVDSLSSIQKYKKALKYSMMLIELYSKIKEL